MAYGTTAMHLDKGISYGGKMLLEARHSHEQEPKSPDLAIEAVLEEFAIFKWFIFCILPIPIDSS